LRAKVWQTNLQHRQSAPAGSFLSGTEIGLSEALWKQRAESSGQLAMFETDGDQAGCADPFIAVGWKIVLNRNRAHRHLR